MTLREDLMAKIEGLDEEQLNDLLRYINLLLEEKERFAKYDPAKDPILTGEALFSGPTDLAERTEEILYGEGVEHKA